jgi:acetolactate synthase-1/2/3 large subunit
VSVSFRCQDLFDNRHPHYVGDVGIGINPRLAERVREADLLLAIGGRLGDITTGGYTLIQAPRPEQKLVRVHPDPQELGQVYGADLPINAGVGAFAAAVAELAPVAGYGWRDWLEAARGDYLAWIVPTRIPGELQLGEIVAWLRERLPEDAIVTNGAGNYTAWVHRFYQYRRYRTQLAPRSGSMGYGLPAAVAAKLVYPERAVICFAGDGCFQMTLQELATAVQYGVNIVVIVVNNGSWGTIRMHQERRFPGRVTGTDLVNPDFVALARAYGGHAEEVRCTEAFPAAFEAALASGKPALLELCLDLEALTPGASLSEMRALGKQAMHNH